MTTTSSPAGSPAGLYHKLAAITAEISWVPEDGKHFQGYRYTSKDAILAALKPILRKYPVAFVPRLVRREDLDMGTSAKGTHLTLTRVEVEYTVVGPETGETATIPWWGEAMDSEGKGLIKALAAALKTVTINLFQVPCGDDDQDGASFTPTDRSPQGTDRQSRQPAESRQSRQPATPRQAADGTEVAPPPQPAQNGNGHGADRERILGFLGGFVEQAKAAHLFDDAYPVPSFTDWTTEQLKAYGTALKAAVHQSSAPDPTPLAEVRDRLTAALPQPSAASVAASEVAS